MFLLKDLPTDQELGSLAKRYPGMRPGALKACLLLMRIGSGLSHGFEAVLSQDNLSQGRFLVLAVLNRDPEKGLTPSALAEKAGVTPPTMTGLLDGLEKAGLVCRKPKPGDRRSLVVELTPKGRKKIDALLPERFRTASQLMGNLAEAEQDELCRLLEKAFPWMAGAAD